MRLYLSSFRIGTRSDQLVRLTGDHARVAVIANAMDAAPPDVRRSGVELEMRALAALGLDPVELDLREYFSNPTTIRERLREFDAAWLRGGNVFTLRYAMAKSGADVAFVDLLSDDAIVYAGYSAGPCVLAPSLEGFERVDSPDQVQSLYGDAPIFEGLGVVDFAFVPHVDSPDHPESEDMNKVIRSLQERHVAHRTLRDGEVLSVDQGVITHFE